VAAPLRSVLARRLFSLSGVAPLGAFLALHVAFNARALRGDAAFAALVDALGRVRALPLLEAVFVFAPLLVHGAIGSWLVVTGAPLRSPDTPYPAGVRVAMRATAVAALLFLAMHLWELRLGLPGGRPRGSELGTLVAAQLSSTWMSIPWRAAAYLVGTAAITFHFVAGVWGLLAVLPGGQAAMRRRWTAWGAGAVGAAAWVTLANVVVFQATGARLLGEPAGEMGAGEACPAPGKP